DARSAESSVERSAAVAGRRSRAFVGLPPPDHHQGRRLPGVPRPCLSGGRTLIPVIGHSEKTLRAAGAGQQIGRANWLWAFPRPSTIWTGSEPTAIPTWEQIDEAIGLLPRLEHLGCGRS